MSLQFKEEREKCWFARDEYWKCLDANNEKNDKCAKFRKTYEKLCSKQWVKHFDRKRKYDQYKANIDNVGWEFPKEKN